MYVYDELKYDENEEYMKLSGNKKEMLLFVDQNTKHRGLVFRSGPERGNVRGMEQKLPSIPERVQRNPPGWKVDAGGVRVSV